MAFSSDTDNALANLSFGLNPETTTTDDKPFYKS